MVDYSRSTFHFARGNYAAIIIWTVYWTSTSNLPNTFIAALATLIAQLIETIGLVLQANATMIWYENGPYSAYYLITGRFLFPRNREHTEDNSYIYQWMPSFP